MSFINGPAATNDTFKDWTIDPSLAHDSDHFGIRFMIDHGRKEIDNPHGLKYNIKDTNPNKWLKAFGEELGKVKNILDPLCSTTHLDTMQLDMFANTLTNVLQQTTSKVSKPCKPSSHAKP